MNEIWNVNNKKKKKKRKVKSLLISLSKLRNIVYYYYLSYLYPVITYIITYLSPDKYLDNFSVIDYNL